MNSILEKGKQFFTSKLLFGISIVSCGILLEIVRRRRVKSLQLKKTPYVKSLAKLSKLQIQKFDLSAYRIYISNSKELHKKLKEMKSDGIHQLNVISDYDLTISSFRLKNEENLTAYQVLVKSHLSSQSFIQQSHQLDLFYMPFEKDSSIPFEQKRHLMSEWYQKINDLIIAEKFTLKKVSETIAQREIGIRYNFKEFYNEFSHKGVPFYIISGGISDFVSTVVENLVDFHSKPVNRIFSNSFVFDKDGVMVEIEKVINTSTKKTILHDNKIPYRKNALLLGDLPGDVTMADNIDAKNVIKIGFLHNLSELETYKKLFDIVVEGEGDWVAPHMIASFISGSNRYIDSIQEIERLNNSNVYEELIRLFEHSH